MAAVILAEIGAGPGLAVVTAIVLGSHKRHPGTYHPGAHNSEVTVPGTDADPPARRPALDVIRTRVPVAPPPPRLEVVFLGTAAASGIAHLPTSSMVLRYGDQNILIDAGGRSLTQLRRAGIDPQSLTAVVITHWHTDHIAGLPTLLAAAASRPQRTTPLTLYAPPPPRGVAGSLGIATHKLNVRLQTVTSGLQIPVAGGTITAVTTDHVVASFGYVFEESGDAGRKVVFSGDTRPSPELLEAARGADLLVHEATFVSARSLWAHKIGHSTAAQAAALAVSAGAGALALTHVSVRDDRPQILREAQAVYPGAMLPVDLEVVEVRPRTRPTLRRPEPRLRAGWARLRRRQIPAPPLPDVDGLAS